jgi:hypothetical protein
VSDREYWLFTGRSAVNGIRILTLRQLCYDPGDLAGAGATTPMTLFHPGKNQAVLVVGAADVAAVEARSRQRRLWYRLALPELTQDTGDRRAIPGAWLPRRCGW